MSDAAGRDKHRDTQTIQLAAILDVRAAGPLAAELAARRGQDVTLDACEVRRLGAQCLQVLLSARASWAAEGVCFRVSAPSDDFTDTLTLLGAASFFSSHQASGDRP